MQKVLKREVVEGEKAKEAGKRIQRAIRKQRRVSQARAGRGQPEGYAESEGERAESEEEQEEDVVAEAVAEQPPREPE